MPAGYSGTPLAQKLGIKPGHRVALLNAPIGFETSLDGLAASATLHRDPRSKGPFNVIVSFHNSLADFTGRFDSLRARLDPSGGLWIAWPKRASGVSTDLSENAIRDLALAAGLVDNKVCAIDEVWSGLRIVVRLKDRPSLSGAKPASRGRPSKPAARKRTK